MATELLRAAGCPQADTEPHASAALLATLVGVTGLLAAVQLPSMALALSASGSRAGITAACLASAAVSWALVPVLWDWLAARLGPDSRLSSFVPAVPPSARPRRGARSGYLRQMWSLSAQLTCCLVRRRLPQQCWSHSCAGAAACSALAGRVCTAAEACLPHACKARGCQHLCSLALQQGSPAMALSNQTQDKTRQDYNYSSQPG